MQQQTINFSVDAKLLQELGERLVGKPYIALAELVKNAYDADATFAEIVFDPEKAIGRNANEKGEIIVRDDGHGMTFEDFRDFWMRVGTTHKQGKISSYFGRQMTGSKGVGRLSVQFLAHRLELKTVPKQQGDTPSWIWAYVDWDSAVDAGDLTSATVVYEIRDDAPPFEHGTELRLEVLKQPWSIGDLEALAREVWWLQPPFRKDIRSLPPAECFEIRFVGNEEAFAKFQHQIDAVLQIQMARVIGTYDQGRAKVAIEFWHRGSLVEVFPYEYTLTDIALPEYRVESYDPKSNLHRAKFEIHIYKAAGKQPFEISVDRLREYLEQFAGVHVYDGPFRLPYYGKPENDWLGIEYDHSQRMFKSKLLPPTIQEAFKDTERLRYLPTLRRMIGTVRINTSLEEKLQIAITRDRLIDSQAHEDLKMAVRYALDLYAYHAARKAAQAKSESGRTEKPGEAIRKIEDVLAEHKERLPEDIYQSLDHSLREASKSIETTIETEKDATLSRLSLLAPLATAGISALAIQHELRKQFGRLDDIIEELKRIRTGSQQVDARFEGLAEDLQEWLGRARTTNMLFDYMTGETIKERQRYRAMTVVQSVLKQMTFMSRGVLMDTSNLNPELYLPEASFAEWGAILQNVFSNAFNAMFGMETRILAISSRSERKHHILLVQDTGKGVDLKKAEKLFEPFERAMENDPARIRMGYGGTGLGLTIVRLLSDRIGCTARFSQPDLGFSTAFALEWQERMAQR
jgi:signal transduction histidine kinase